MFGIRKVTTLRVIAVTLFLAGASVAQTAALGDVNAKSLNGIRFADQYPGKDIGAKVNAAIGDVGAAGGIILIPKGTFVFNTPIAADNTRSIQIWCAGGLTGGAPGATQLLYEGKSSPVISARSSVGFTLRGCQLEWTNRAFAGAVVELGHSGAASDSSYAEIASNSFYGSPAHGGPLAGIVIDADKAVNSTIHDNVFSAYKVGIRGAVNHTSYSNAIEVARNRFSDSVGTAATAHIQNPAQAWQIHNNTFEMGTAAGAPTVIGFTASAAGKGIVFSGNWIGDTTQKAAVTDLMVSGSGWTIAGNYFGGSPASTAISLGANARAITVSGNQFDTFSVAIAFGSGNDLVSVVANSTASVSKDFTGTPAGGLVAGVSGVGAFYGGAWLVGGSRGLPADAGQSALHLASGFGSRSVGRIYVGDGGGWKLEFARRSNSTDVVVGTVDDSGRGTFSGGISTGSLATGAAPITTSSATVSPNLNADMVDGVHADSASAGRAVCWKDTTHLGYCTTPLDANGACTCR